MSVPELALRVALLELRAVSHDLMWHLLSCQIDRVGSINVDVRVEQPEVNG